MEIVKWMAVRFEISLFWAYCVGVYVVNRESSNYSVAKSYTEVLIGCSPTSDLVDEHFSGKL